MPDAEDAGKDKGVATPKAQQPQLPPNLRSMQAPMGPQGGGAPSGSGDMAAQAGLPQGIPTDAMTRPQEWEWLTMSL
jgi:GATA-binding protein